MARTVQARLDEAGEADLALLRAGGLSDSEAVRVALREAAHRRRSRLELRREAALAAADERDRAEARTVRQQMDALAADWPV